MDLIPNIPISFYNKTGSIDFDVMVFAKNYAMNYSLSYCLAWRILRGQGSVNFNFPRKLQVGAQYNFRNQVVRCRSLDAKPGTTWEIIHENPEDTAVMQQGSSGCY